MNPTTPYALARKEAFDAGVKARADGQERKPPYRALPLQTAWLVGHDCGRPSSELYYVDCPNACQADPETVETIFDNGMVRCPDCGEVGVVYDLREGD